MADITFHNLDFSEDFETELLEIAEHFKVRRKYFMSFAGIVNVSKRWRKETLEQDLRKWESRFIKVGGNQQLIELVKNAFRKCGSTKKIHKLRGSLVEALLLSSQGGRDRLNDPANFGWGAAVVIKSDAGEVEVGYTCGIHCSFYEEPTGCNTERCTVDVGHWNGHHGKFFECKAFPELINCIDVEYLRELNSKLVESNVSHEIFFLCLDDREEIKIKLKEKNAPDFFKAIGLRELETMIPA